MPAAPPNDSYQSVFKSVAGQGDQFQGPLSPSGQYSAFLSKVDATSTGMYDLMFEMVALEWVQNSLFSSPVSIEAPAPSSPALIYHIEQIAESTLLSTLGVTSIDSVAEGSWYLLTLESAPGGIGTLYDPDIDTLPQS